MDTDRRLQQRDAVAKADDGLLPPLAVRDDERGAVPQARQTRAAWGPLLGTHLLDGRPLMEWKAAAVGVLLWSTLSWHTPPRSAT